MTLTAIAKLVDPSARFVDIPPFWAGSLALALIAGAYATESFRGAFLGVERGQIDAAQSLGLNAWQVFLLVRFPQAWRIALPAFGNHMISLVKDTALVSVIGLNEIMFTAKMATSVTDKPFTMFAVVALIYLAFTHRAHKGIPPAGDAGEPAPGAMSFDLSLVWESLPRLTEGLGLTVQLLLSSLLPSGCSWPHRPPGR